MSLKITAVVDLGDIYTGGDYCSESVESIFKSRLEEEVLRAARDVLKEEIRKAVKQALSKHDKDVKQLIQEAKKATLALKESMLRKELEVLKK